jgi:hypothetical protein
MSERTQLEARLLNAAELEVVKASRAPATQQASNEQLKVLVQRLRRARDRAKDVAARQKPEMRGKAHPRGAKPTRATRVRSQRPRCLRRPLNALRRN